MKCLYELFSSAENQHLEIEILLFLINVGSFFFFFCDKCLFTVYAQLIEELLIFMDVHDLLHIRVPCEFLRGKDRERVILIAVRQSLKKANYENFDVLLEALKHFDKVSALKRHKCKGKCGISAPVL